MDSSKLKNNLNDITDTKLNNKEISGKIIEATQTKTEITESDTDIIYNRIEIMNEMLNNFCYNFCDLVASIIMTVEDMIYENISSGKIEDISISDLSDSKNEPIKELLILIIETIFDKIFKMMSTKKNEDVIKKIYELETFITPNKHSTFCYLKMLARKTFDILNILPRHNFLTTSRKKYNKSVQNYLEGCLQENIKTIPIMLLDKEYCDGKCNKNNPKSKLKSKIKFRFSIKD